MVSVAPVERKDVMALTALMERLDRFYGETNFPPEATRAAEIEQSLFGPTPAAYVLLAWDDRKLIGMAASSFLWPAVGISCSLFLKELWVDEPYRRAGVGTALMAEVFALASNKRCSRVEWMTEEENESAQRFYKSLGHSPFDGKLFYRANCE